MNERDFETHVEALFDETPAPLQHDAAFQAELHARLDHALRRRHVAFDLLGGLGVCAIALFAWEATRWLGVDLSLLTAPLVGEPATSVNVPGLIALTLAGVALVIPTLVRSLADS